MTAQRHMANPGPLVRKLVNGKALFYAKPHKRMSYRIKEYLIWAGLIFVAIVAVVVFGGNV